MGNRLREIKENAVTTKQHDFITEIPYEDFEWLVKQAEIVSKIKGFCEHEANTYDELKMDETRHKVDRIFFNGKQRAFTNVRCYIENLEES